MSKPNFTSFANTCVEDAPSTFFTTDLQKYNSLKMNDLTMSRNGHFSFSIIYLLIIFHIYQSLVIISNA